MATAGNRCNVVFNSFRGLTREALARASGLSLSNLQKIESGATKDILLTTAKSIADSLNVTIDSLLDS